MKKQRFLFALFMAIVMMAMSPGRAWADYMEIYTPGASCQKVNFENGSATVDLTIGQWVQIYLELSDYGWGPEVQVNSVENIYFGKEGVEAVNLSDGTVGYLHVSTTGNYTFTFTKREASFSENIDNGTVLDNVEVTLSITCNSYVEHTHVFDQENIYLQGAMVTDATCTETGSCKKSCLCGVLGEETFVVPVKGHYYGENSNVIASPATCTEDAYYYAKCTSCDEVSSDKTFVDLNTKLGHDWADAGDGVHHACQREGCEAQEEHAWRNGTCTVCQAIDPNFVGVTVDKSSGGFDDEGPENLFDGNPETKWCSRCELGSEGEDLQFYVIFHPSKRSVLASYTLEDAEDTYEHENRKWSSWVILGGDEKDTDDWVVIDQHKDENYSGETFTIDYPTAYNYYKLKVIPANWEDVNNVVCSIQQMADMNITWSCEHNWKIVYDEDQSYCHHCTKCDVEECHYVAEEDGKCVCGYQCSEHSYHMDDYASVKATENADGQYIVVKICEYCQHEKTETVDPDGECPEGGNHSWADNGTINATCTAKGYTYHICKKCEMLYVADFTPVDPDNHNWSVEEQWNEEGEIVSMHSCNNGCEEHGSWAEHTMADGKCTVCGYWPGHTEHQWDMTGADHRCTIPGCEEHGEWEEHEIEGCVCTICGNACHEWWEGVCINCDTRCEHKKKVWHEEAQEATCMSQGKAVDYYQCECGLIFEDEECTNPLSWDDIIIPATGHSIDENGTCTACGARVTIADDTLSFEYDNTVTFWNGNNIRDYDSAAALLYSFECDGNGNLTISSNTDLPDAFYSIFGSDYNHIGAWNLSTSDVIMIDYPGTYYLRFMYYGLESEEKVENQSVTLHWQGPCQHENCSQFDEWNHICNDCGESINHSVGEDGKCVCGFECPGHEWTFDVNDVYEACQDQPYTMIQHCVFCQYTKQEVVVPNGECPNGDSHDWYENSYAATCAQHGYTEHWCDNCDARYLDNFSADIDPDAHDWCAEQDGHWCCNGCEAHGSYEEHTDFESVDNWNHICKECGERFKHSIGEDGECVCGFKCTKHRFYVNAIASVEETESKNDGKIYVVEECEYCQVQGEPKVVDTKSECSKSKNHNHFWVRYTTDEMPTTKEGGIAKISCWYCDESYFVRVPADPHACANDWGHEWEKSEGNIVCINEDCDITVTPAATLAMGENAGIYIDASVHHYFWDPSTAPLYKFVPETSGPYDFKIKENASADCKVFIFETNEDDCLDMNIQDGDHYAFEARKNYYLQFLTTDVDGDREPIAYEGATIVVSESTQLVIAAAADASGDSEPVVIAKDEQTGEWSTEQNIVLTDGVESFSTPVDFTAPQVDYERLMPNSPWGTLCLPFDITIDAAKPYAFYELTSATSTEVTLTKVDDGTLQAGTPVLVRRNASETGVHFTETSKNGITIKAMRDQSESEVKDGLQMVGVFMPYELYGGSYYLDAEDGMLYDTGKYYNETGDPVKVNAYRCYFDVVGGHVEAKELNINFDDGDATAIGAVNALTEGTAKFYDLNGRQQNDLHNGVNIVKYGNGITKKVIIK